MKLYLKDGNVAEVNITPPVLYDIYQLCLFGTIQVKFRMKVRGRNKLVDLLLSLDEDTTFMMALQDGFPSLPPDVPSPPPDTLDESEEEDWELPRSTTLRSKE